ncbi:kelch repeat and BTB domain-containing protein 2 [Biomphalaria glabrata]
MASEDSTWIAFNRRHVMDIFQCLGKFLESEELHDTIVVVGNTQFKCYKPILAAYSGYFRTAFNSKLNENKNIYRLEEISCETFKLIRHAMHTGCTIVTEDNVIDLMKAADYLNIPFLENECARFIQEVLSLENCLNFYLSGKHFNSEKVKNFVWPFILENFYSLCHRDNFLDLSTNDLLKLVQSQI